MEEKRIKINIRYSFDKNYVVEIKLSSTVLELKEECSKLVNIPASSLNLIYKGKMLVNADTLASYKLENEHAMHLVAAKDKGADSKTGSSATNQSSQQAVPTNLNSGGTGMLNSFGMAGLGPSTDYQAVSSMMNNPLFNQMINQMLSNPQMMESLINSNPMLRNMTEQNPEILSALRDPTTLQMMRDPQVISGAMGMLNRMNPNQASSMGGGPNLPMPGSVGLNANTPANTSAASGATQQPPAGGLGAGVFPGWSFPGFGFNPLGQSQQQQQPQQGQALGQEQQSSGVGGQQAGSGTQNPGPQVRNPFMGFNPMFSPWGIPNTASQAGQNPATQQAGTNAGTGAAPMNPFGGMPFGMNPFMMGFQPSQQAQVNYEEKFKDQLKTLEEMGFVNKEANLKALIATGGNVELAIERMINLLG